MMISSIANVNHRILTQVADSAQVDFGRATLKTTELETVSAAVVDVPLVMIHPHDVAWIELVHQPEILLDAVEVDAVHGSIEGEGNDILARTTPIGTLSANTTPYKVVRNVRLIAQPVTLASAILDLVTGRIQPNEILSISDLFGAASGMKE